ncbi:helix-turn-helix transcriptional regulator [Candidatus Poribacteria bacterium]|nr:helix-turn-helix transcriptional regulator [Candidatus Poribacteria bacterium]
MSYRRQPLLNLTNLLVSKLAKNLDLSPSQIGRLCNAIYSLSLELIVKLADYFNITTDHILGKK